MKSSSEVVDLIHILCRLCQKRNKLMFKKLNIKEGEFNFFMSVTDFTNLSILQISNLMDIHQGTVSRIIDRLVKRGFLVRSLLSDKRSVTVSFTKKGKEMYELALEVDNYFHTLFVSIYQSSI